MTGFRNITGFRKIGVRATLIMLTLHFPAHSATIEIYPGDSFRDAVQELAAGDTLIIHSGKYSDAGRINIIFASPGIGFNSHPHQGVTPSNLEFTNNTIIGGHPCIDLRGWNNRQGLVLANNAIYCAGGLPAPGTLIGVTIAGNVILPGTARLKSKHATPGRSVELDFTDPANRSFYPSTDSPLIDAGESAWMPATDFNGTPRDAVGDAGAYEKSAPTNPGWAIMPGFKERQRIHE